MIAAIKKVNNQDNDADFEVKLRDFIQVEIINVENILIACDYFHFLGINFDEKDLE